MYREAAEQRTIDEEHLRLLRLAYFIAAAWNLFFVFFPLIYVAMGLFVMFLPRMGKDDAPPFFVGLVFVIIGLTVCLIMAAVTLMKFLSARAIGARRRRVLCLVTAGISCLAFPYGTAIGVATFIVLQRPSVVAMFEQR